MTLIECWFGPFPPWHDLFLKTCEANQDVRWLIAHDAPAPRRRPGNVQFVPMTLKGLEDLASHTLPTPVRLARPFKVCDLRPAFGQLFQGYLGDSAFWGYSDSDLFWGRIGDFITPEILKDFDVITACRTSLCGQFTIFRNSGVTRCPHELLPDYPASLLSPTPQYLDEGPMDAAVQRPGVRVLRRQLQVHDIGSPEWEEKARELELREKGHLGDWFWEGGACKWENGRITHLASGRPAMFFHFKSWKSLWRKTGRLARPLLYSDRDMSGFVADERGIHPLFQGRVRPATQHFLRQTLPDRLNYLRGASVASARAVLGKVRRRVRQLVPG